MAEGCAPPNVSDLLTNLKPATMPQLFQNRFCRQFLLPGAALLGIAAGLQAEPDIIPSMGGMVSPEIDEPGKPFSYFRNPTDILGTYLAPAASQVTPEGFVYNGFGDLMFFIGNPPVPVNQRIRTLRDGVLPIVEYSIEKEGVRYAFTMFASDLGGPLERLPVNFIRIEARNLTDEPRTVFMSSAYRFTPPTLDSRGEPEYRFLQNFGALPQRFTAGQTKFDPSWRYSSAADSLVRNGRVLYLFPEDPVPFQKSLSLGRRAQSGARYLSGQIEMGKAERSSAKPEIPVGLVTYKLTLSAGESQTIDLKYPIVPLPENSEEISQVKSASFDQELERVLRFWKTKVSEKIPLFFPEEKVQQALVANTCYLLLALNQLEGTIFPVCNKFQYNSHPNGYVTSHIVMGLGEIGYPGLATEAALYDVRIQAPNGQWGNGRYWGYFGEIAITWGRIWELTRDREFLKKVFPSLMRGARRMEEVVREDPHGVLPPISLDDDEMLQETRFTGQNVRTLQGLLYAMEMARALDAKGDVEFLSEFYTRLRSAFDKLMEEQTKKTGGYIPPAMDVTTGGNDWDNLQLLHPVPLYDSFDPRIDGQWRGFVLQISLLLIPLVAYAVLHLTLFSEAAAPIKADLEAIADPTVRMQMTVPIFLTHVLPAGMIGLFAAVILSSAVSCDNSYLHSWGSIFIQDVLLPLRKKPVTPKTHLLLLRISIIGVALFGFTFSLLFPIKGYVLMYFAVTAAIYAGGIGAVLIGGLYWERGTTLADWVAMSTGSALAFGGLLVDQGWSGMIAPKLLHLFPDSAWLATHAEKFPINGQVIYFIAMLSASLLYILISLFGPQQKCDMDKLLHRGAYALPEDKLAGSVHQRHSWREMLGLTREFTRGDKIVFWSTATWSVGWWLIFLGGAVYDWIWGTTDALWSWFWWGKIWLSAILCIAFTAWFSLGGMRDSIHLFKTLKARRAAALESASRKDRSADKAVVR